MRKMLLILCLFLFSPLLLVASTSQSRNIVLDGYYNPPDKPLTLSVWDYNDTALYYTDSIISSEHLESSGHEIFHWSLSGTMTAGFRLIFTFSDFQAEKSSAGPYFRPAYQIQQSRLTSDALTYDSSGSTEAVVSTKSSSATSFGESYSYVYRVIATGLYTSTGEFSMKISDYETGEGDLSYHSSVTVTYEGP